MKNSRIRHVSLGLTLFLLAVIFNGCRTSQVFQAHDSLSETAQPDLNRLQSSIWSETHNLEAAERYREKMYKVNGPFTEELRSAAIDARQKRCSDELYLKALSDFNLVLSNRVRTVQAEGDIYDLAHHKL